jgi:hypothetical protein
MVDLAVGPDPAAMDLDDPVNDREPDAGALELARRVEPVERREQLARVPHVKARGLADQVEDLVDRPAGGIVVGPASQRLRDRVQELDLELGVGRNHPVADRPQHGREPLLAFTMQARQLGDDAALAPLGECRARVEAIALIHDKLHQTPPKAHTNGPVSGAF